MDLKKIKYIFSEKYNQFYKPVRIDENVRTIYMQIIKNRHEKGVKKNEILRIEDKTEYKYVVMYDVNITAEKNFLRVMNSNRDIRVKLNELRFFKKNLLDTSELAMKKLKDLMENDNLDIKIHNEALKIYTGINSKSHKETIYSNRASYNNQEIPNKVKQLALAKRLFIERSDEYCGKKTHRHPANRRDRLSLRTCYPCGFVIKDRGGNVVAGDGYTILKDDVIRFVENYIPTEEEKHCTTLYRVPMSFRKRKLLAMCHKILEKHGLHYKNEHNYFFWVLDKQGNVIAGGKNGFGFKWLLKYCRRLRSRLKNNLINYKESL